MRFRQDNQIPYGQDFGFYRGVPSGVDFKVEKSTGELFDVPGLFRLTAYGYGQLEPYDEHSYGNGALHVSSRRLTARQRSRLRKGVTE